VTLGAGRLGLPHARFSDCSESSSVSRDCAAPGIAARFRFNSPSRFSTPG
jgi:hypothetical protein